MQWLPCKHDLTIFGTVKVCPEEGRSIARKLGGSHQHVEQPIGSLVVVQREMGPLGVSESADKVQVWQLEIETKHMVSTRCSYLQLDGERRAGELTILSDTFELGSAILDTPSPRWKLWAVYV